MFILISHDEESGICLEGKFATHREAYKKLLACTKDYWERESDKPMPTMDDYPIDTWEVEDKYDDLDYIAYRHNGARYSALDMVIQWQIFEV